MILICRKGLAGMHFQVRSDPDLLKKPGRDAFCEGKVILICRKVCSGMHLQGKSDPDLLKKPGRDAFTREK